MRRLAWALLLGACDTGGESAPAVDAAAAGADAGREVDARSVEADAAPDPWIEIGTGARAFEPLGDAQEVPVIRGLQGGFHVWGSIRGDGFSGADALVDFELHLGDRLLAWAYYEEPQLPRDDDGHLEYPGVAVIYGSNDDVEPTSGQAMRLSVRVRDGGGADLTDEITVVPICCENP